MRITLANWNGRIVGGAETYLNKIVSPLLAAGHELSFFCEVDEPLDREPIFPGKISCVSSLGVVESLEQVRRIQPDLIFTHGILDPKIESSLLKIAPAVLFAHGYYGTCISGTKTKTRPEVSCCSRVFGPGCLLEYFPRRCGGLNPLTMVSQYRLQKQRLALLSQYRAIIVQSKHMKSEYLRHGIAREKIFDLSTGFISDSAGVGGTAVPATNVERTTPRAKRGPSKNGEPHALADDREAWHLLFLGRMEFLKGGSVFLEAIPQIRATLGRPLEVTFAGDGTQRAQWEKTAATLQAKCSDVKVHFPGWLDGQKTRELIDRSDLLVMPSLWSEPFGLVGLEAGRSKVPTAAFAVGGIPDWLVDGYNGHLATDAASSSSLAEAVCRCLSDSATQQRLGKGAAATAKRFDQREQVAALLRIFDEVVAATV